MKERDDTKKLLIKIAHETAQLRNKSARAFSRSAVDRAVYKAGRLIGTRSADEQTRTLMKELGIAEAGKGFWLEVDASSGALANTSS